MVRGIAAAAEVGLVRDAELEASAVIRQRKLGWLEVGTGVWMTGAIVAAFLWAPEVRNLRGTQILYFHVPCAWLASLAFLGSGVYAGLYLRRRDLILDVKSAAAAELGLLFCTLATVTGAVFAKANWGMAWNWDPRQTTIAALLMLYLAYFALRSALVGTERRAAVSSAYAVMACVVMPFLVYVLPRAFETLHPTVVRRGGMDPEIVIMLMVATVGFTGLGAWMFQLRVAVGAALLRRMEELV
ncbi:MAG: cytochrome c biogenesis protein CcsA [Armatimonadota bacterium]